MDKLIAHIRLTRPANIITAIADILAGFAISGAAVFLFPLEDGTWFGNLLWLVISTIGLYGGGVAFNDVFDAELDKVERPERPIPSGKASIKSASIMAAILLLAGITAAWQVSLLSGLIAFGIAFLAVLYDAWGKHQPFLGPVNMGLCRSGNLLLGVSVIPEMVQVYWFMGLIPLLYVAAITMISRGEVHGKNKKALQGGFLIYIIIIITILGVSFFQGAFVWAVVPFLFLLGYLIFPPLWKAIQEQNPQLIGKAVKAGVISLIVLNASLAAAFAGWTYGLIILLLLPLSLWMAKKFAVT